MNVVFHTLEWVYGKNCNGDGRKQHCYFGKCVPNNRKRDAVEQPQSEPVKLKREAEAEPIVKAAEPGKIKRAAEAEPAAEAAESVNLKREAAAEPAVEAAADANPGNICKTKGAKSCEHNGAHIVCSPPCRAKC